MNPYGGRLIAAWILALFIATVAFAAHNLVTIRIETTTSEMITGNVEVKNTIESAQTGMLHLAVFGVDDQERLDQQAKIDLGTFDLVAGAGNLIAAPFMLDLKEMGLEGEKLLLVADFKSMVNGREVAHSHASGIVVIAAAEEEPPEAEEPPEEEEANLATRTAGRASAAGCSLMP